MTLWRILILAYACFVLQSTVGLWCPAAISPPVLLTVLLVDFLRRARPAHRIPGAAVLGLLADFLETGGLGRNYLLFAGLAWCLSSIVLDGRHAARWTTAIGMVGLCTGVTTFASQLQRVGMGAIGWESLSHVVGTTVATLVCASLWFALPGNCHVSDRAASDQQRAHDSHRGWRPLRGT